MAKLESLRIAHLKFSGARILDGFFIAAEKRRRVFSSDKGFQGPVLNALSHQVHPRVTGRCRNYAGLPPMCIALQKILTCYCTVYYSTILELDCDRLMAQFH